MPDHPGIDGAPTSVTAFVGRTRRGPVDRPVAVSSYGEFESVYGGRWDGSALPEAVRDFFVNGGGSAVVARLHRADGGASTAVLALGSLELVAVDEGEWGNELLAQIEHDAGEQLFTLSVRDGTTGTLEIFTGLSVAPDHPRFVTAILAAQSRLVRVATPGPERPDATPDAAGTGGSDGQPLDDEAFVAVGLQAAERGLYLLEQADDVNLLVIPPYSPDGGVGTEVVAAAAEYCEERRAVLLVDPPPAWRSVPDVLASPRRRRASNAPSAPPAITRPPSSRASGAATPHPGRARAPRRVPSPASSPAPTCCAGCGRPPPAWTRR